MTTWGWANARGTFIQSGRKILIHGKMMTIYLDDFFRPDWANSKAMNILLGPLFDVAGYAYAAAAVLAPFSGFNIVTGFEKSKRGRVFWKKHGELTTQERLLFVDQNYSSSCLVTDKHAELSTTSTTKIGSSSDLVVNFLCFCFFCTN